MCMKLLHIHYFMPQGIGDIVMTIPVIKEIARLKNVKFSITVQSQVEATVIRELCPELSIVFIYLQDIFKETGKLISFLNVIIRIRNLSPDIILTQINVSSAKSSLTSFLSGVKSRVGWKGPFSFLNTLTLIPSGLHRIAENMKSIKILDVDPNKVKIAYPFYQPRNFNSTTLQINDILKSNLIKIALSPGSGELYKHKRWPKFNYSQLVNKIFQNHENILICLLGNEREKLLCNEIMQKIDKKTGAINLAGKTDITEILAILSIVKLTITNCNGISHLACAANSPIIGLYGPTNFNITGPISNNFIPISAGLDCSPCYRRDYQTGCEDPICMEAITVDMVYQKLKRMIVDIKKPVPISNQSI
jgi:heptosyltransferase-2